MDDNKHTVHGPPVQSRVAAAYRAVPAARATILAHMVMNGGKCKRAAGMGSRQRQADKAVVANGPVVTLTSTGLAVKQPADEVAGTGLVANSQ